MQNTTTDNLDVHLLPCAEKMAFDHKKEAEAAGTAAEWQHGGSLKAYKCRHCHLWHLASA